jgi:hypothetical protein
MIRRLRSAKLRQIDFVPQAVVGHPATYFEKNLRVKMASGSDDLDEYYGAAFILNNETPFVLRHYKGHPTNTMTIYLPSEYRSVDQITEIVSRIVQELQIERNDLIWQRADDPGL